MRNLFIFLLLGWAQLQASYVWQPPVSISNPIQDADLQAIALDPSGNAVAVWRNVSLLVVQAATKLFGQPWSDPVVISSLTAGVDGPPMVQVDAQGNAIVVWVETPGMTSQLNSAIKLFGQPWSAPDLIPGSSGAEDYDLAMDLNGNITVVFDILNPGPGGDKIWSSEKTLLGSWSAAVQISAVGTNDVFPSIGVDSSGNVTASWGDDTNGNIMAATKPFGMPWQLPGQIIIGGSNTAFPAASVAVNPGGDAIVLALNGSGAITAFKPFNQAWQAPQQIPGSMNAILIGAFPGIGLDNQGNAIAVWYNTSGALSLSTQLSGQPWSTGQTFSSPAAPNDLIVSVPSISIDPCGLVLFGWNGNGIQVLSGTIGGTFSMPVTIGSGLEPFTAQNPCNHAMVTWDNAAGVLLPGPSQVSEGFIVTGVNSFSGAQQTINFGTEKSFTNHLVWTKSSTIGVSNYRIYRNGALIATLGPTTFAYNDIRQTQNLPIQYSITVVDGNGTETAPMTIHVP